MTVKKIKKGTSAKIKNTKTVKQPKKTVKISAKSTKGTKTPKPVKSAYQPSRKSPKSVKPAVKAKKPVVQSSKKAVSKIVTPKTKAAATNTPNLTVTMGLVEDILLDQQGAIEGIRTREGALYAGKAMVITTGTFLNGLIHMGHTNYTAGRQGEEASVNLAQFLKNLQLQVGRLKTGTPPRLMRSSLDFSKMEIQESDPLDYLFEYTPHTVEHKMPCYITHTTKHTHDIIRNNAELSPIYSGKIKGTAPRYCPSIEDKITRFADKDSHHVFVEPESASSDEIYPNGLSTSLPLSAQVEFIRSIPGFENAVIARPGYAIEYDFVMPTELTHSLELKKCPNLFLAGQINGTTGYEEAAGQGIIAGINAHLKVHGKEPYVISRNDGYIGIMIDDLVTLGVDEPYRMFTSRAERRLILRQDNVFERFAHKAHELGLISTERYESITQEAAVIRAVTKACQKACGLEITRLLSDGNTDAVHEIIKTQGGDILSSRGRTTVLANLLYEPYLKREEREIEKMTQYAALAIPSDFEFTDIPGLSVELQQKLTKYRPRSIAAAALIQGMTPAAISLLIFKVRFSQQLTSHPTPGACDAFGN